MGLNSKLVSSDGLEFEYCSSSRALSREQVVGTDQRLIPGTVKRQPLQDRTTDQSEPVKCPRCESTNTKFCYFNNYNKSQPRHFCKTCRRHWTRGGTLRNVPVGGSRKNKRLKTASASATATAAIITTPVVADHMSARSNISNGILSPPHQDILNSVQFPASGLPIPWQAGIRQEGAAAAASSWSWEDIESLVSTDHGLAWDESKVPLP